MRIGIVGAGGIGCLLGARLAATGQAEVLLLARGEHAARLAEQGLVLDFNGVRETHRLPVIDTANEAALGQLAGCDWLLFACKSQHTRRLAEQLKSYVSADCRLGSLQNGVDNEPILAEVFERPVMGGLMRKFFAHITAPGEVEVRGVLEAVLGDYPTGCGRETTAMVELLRQAGVTVYASEDIRRELWRKLVLNNGCNPLAAVTFLDTQRMANDPDMAWVMRNLMREAGAAAAADEVEFSPHELEAVFQWIKGIDPIKPSMQADAERGKPLELDGITGAVLRRAGQLGIEVPVTATLHHILLGKYGSSD
ncbi:MAG: 2-dehydropantoate 2-reductase [Immundisolibacter sp.]|uniref:ketopantoate reductase family protein n=1 Tax=Immundisolibacter sp. TaxID=1934948 RepID=UPI00198CEED3|nr:2-dehydropantoate 2-reductase [Immundisolibacter sp.]MBC7162478.1 2-dehydropantoate 2-reductase [Immundisolibacter sp.]